MIALGMMSPSNELSRYYSLDVLGVTSISPSIFGAALVFHDVCDRVTPINTLEEMITGFARFAPYIKMC